MRRGGENLPCYLSVGGGGGRGFHIGVGSLYDADRTREEGYFDHGEGWKGVKWKQPEACRDLRMNEDFEKLLYLAKELLNTEGEPGEGEKKQDG